MLSSHVGSRSGAAVLVPQEARAERSARSGRKWETVRCGRPAVSFVLAPVSALASGAIEMASKDGGPALFAAAAGRRRRVQQSAGNSQLIKVHQGELIRYSVEDLAAGKQTGSVLHRRVRISPFRVRYW